jgi:hypothetical protein
MRAATIVVSVMRIPDSPTHSVVRVLVLAGSNAARTFFLAPAFVRFVLLHARSLPSVFL